MDTVGLVFGLIAAAAAAGGVVWAFMRRSGRGLRGLVHLIDDLRGEEDRPGVPGRPGLMERMGSLEDEYREDRAETHRLLTQLLTEVREIRTEVRLIDSRLIVVEGDRQR